MAHRKSYPLAALFVLTAVCGVMASLLTHAFRSDQGDRLAAEVTNDGMILGAVVTTVLGMIVGLFQRQPFSGLLWGALTGLIIGVCSGPLVFMRPNDLAGLVATICIGSVVLVGAGVVVRYL